VVDRFVSVPITLSDLERRDMRGQNFQANLLSDACTVWPRTTKFGRMTQCGFQRAPILSVFLNLCLHPLMQNDQIRHGNMYGEGHVVVNHAIAFAEMHRAVCQRQLSFLFVYRRIMSYVSLFVCLCHSIMSKWKSRDPTHSPRSQLLSTYWPTWHVSNWLNDLSR